MTTNTHFEKHVKENICFCLNKLQIHIEPIYMGDEGQKVPCRFFDTPGIGGNDIFKKDELEKIFNGEIKLNDKVSSKIIHKFN